MKNLSMAYLILCVITVTLILANSSVLSKTSGALIIDHRHNDISALSDLSIENAVKKLRIVYGHTSHGSQITAFKL